MMTPEVAEAMANSVIQSLAEKLDTGHMPELHTHPSNNLVTMIYTTFVEGYISGKPSKALVYLALTEDPEVAQWIENRVVRIEEPS
jgi:hypothetical protein